MNTKNPNIQRFRRTVLLAAALLFAGSLQAAETLWLDSLDLKTMWQGWGQPQLNHSARGTPLSINGQQFAHGLGTVANSDCRLELGGGTDRFIASVGLDDSAGGPASIVFRVVADGKTVFDSGVMKSNTPAKRVDLDLHGVKHLLLKVSAVGNGIYYNCADWADARFMVSGDKPRPVVAWDEVAVILTPRPGPAPRINGPKVYGCRPGHPFLYRIPTQGNRPIRFSANGLPGGLRLDSDTGIITGTAPERGDYAVTFFAKNKHGDDSRRFKIVSGDKLALTPPMGWNHWNAFYTQITDKIVRQSADAMISNGMADVGYQYINIDACWDNTKKNADPLRVGPFRDKQGNLISNHYFPDMKLLADYVHSQGLKAGIYGSPGPTDCASCAGSYQHEAQDAKQFADWGYDLLKYDWCSYRTLVPKHPSLEQMQQPFSLMGKLLQEQNRDMVFSICQYGMGDVWKWGTEVGGQYWRTSRDLSYDLDHIFQAALNNAQHRDYQKPGAWNDPDLIQIGQSAKGPYPFTPTEQYSFMSLWCLMAAPLIYSGDMTKLDAFTLNVLCNPEVIAVDQDPLGQCARVVKLTDKTFLMVKDLADGTKAVGLCNRDEMAHEIIARWSDIGLTSGQPVRDLWREQDLGEFDKTFKTSVPPRGVVLVQIGKAQN